MLLVVPFAHSLALALLLVVSHAAFAGFPNRLIPVPIGQESLVLFFTGCAQLLAGFAPQCSGLGVPGRDIGILVRRGVVPARCIQSAGLTSQFS